jgi:lysophosphatidate acyltransferase
VLDPIPTKGLTTADVDELTRTTRELMLRELVTLTAKARGTRMPTTLDRNGLVKASGIDMKMAS